MPLTPKGFDTLLVLVQNSGQVLTRRELMKQVWPDTIVEENSLSKNICALRRALSETPKQATYIQTISKRGYRFVAEVREGWEELDDLIRERHPRTGTLLRSIAVLPFKSLGVEDSDEYLGLGMADALITRLSNIGQLIVRPTSAVIKYMGLGQDPISIGRELGVDSVLDGRIQKSGRRIRLTVQLVNIQDEAPLWAEKFDAEFTDLFAVQDILSEQVTQALKLKLTRQEKERLATHYTEDTEAYQAYVKGRYFWNKRTREGLTRGIAYFQQAIERDFGYALAYAGLADCYNLLGFYGFLSPMETYPKAKAAALEALEMDDALAEAHNSLAWAKLHFDFDWSGTEREFKQAHQLNPGYATAHHWYTAYLSAMGRLEEAIAEMKRAQMLDPLSLIINTALGQTFYFARQYDLAMEQLSKTLEMDPNFVHAHILLGKVYVQRGMYEKAIAEFQKAINLEGEESPYSRGLLGYAYAVMGNKDGAVKILKELKALSKRRYVPSYNIAEIKAGLGWNDQAFKWLEKAYEQRDGAMVWLKVEPALDSLRSDPRFRHLLRRMRLAP